MQRSLHVPLALLLVVSTAGQLAAQQPAPSAAHVRQYFPLIAGINAITFIDTTKNNTFVGSGFVLRHNGHLYGVTAKHVLLVANHPALKSINPGPLMRSWTMRAANSSLPPIAFGPLLNADSTEALGIGVLERDALVFSLSNAGPFTPLALATEPLQPGDSVFVAGCSYRTEKSCTQNIVAGTYVGHTGVNLLVDLGGTPLAEMGGMSGGPVVNARGELVGITSRSMNDSNGVPRFAPVDLSYLRSVLATVKTSRPTN